MSNVYLQHHGIKGQKWGVRRFQNADGSYTAAGKKRYSVPQDKANRAASEARTAHKLANKYTNAMDRKAEKRQAQADKRGSSTSQDKANRAASEARTAHKIAKKYTDAMDKKAVKRQAQADDFEEKKVTGKKVATKILDKAKNKVADKWTEENKARKEKIREKIRDALFPRMEDDVWNEKPGDYRKQPWDEKPHKKTGGNI